MKLGNLRLTSRLAEAIPLLPTELKFPVPPELNLVDREMLRLAMQQAYVKALQNIEAGYEIKGEWVGAAGEPKPEA